MLPTPNENVNIGKEFNSHKIAFLHRFAVSEVRMSGSCFPKAKAIQSPVHKQINCPSFGYKVLIGL